MIGHKLKQLKEMNLCMQRKWINANRYQALKTIKTILKNANANVMCEYNLTTPLSTLLNGVPRATGFLRK
jgi:hypothetical protein